MSLLRPKDNAAFLKNLYERTRPAFLVGTFIVVAVVVVLLASLCYLIACTTPGFPWARAVFIFLAYAHGFILLASGTSSVFTMAVRERQTGTLDFHRVSPTSPWNIVIGLLLGPPILEWLIVLCTVPIAAGFALYSGAGLPLLLYLYVSLASCVLLFHALGLLGGLTMDPKKVQVYRSGWPMSVVIGLGMASSLGMGAGIAPLCHLTCLPAFAEIARDTLVYPPDMLRAAATRFLYFDLPPLLLQAMVQIPLLFLALTAAIRTVAHPERPILSKLEVLLATGFLFFLFVGGALPYTPDLRHRTPGAGAAMAMVFLYFSIALGLVGAGISTPGALLHRKGLRRMSQEGRRHPNALDDYASHLGWLTGFVLLASTTYVVLGCFGPGGLLLDLILPFLTVLCYVAWFGGTLESFRLGKRNKDKSLFAVLISMPWVFLPFLGFILAATSSSPSIAWYGSAFSPLFGPGIAATAALTEAAVDRPMGPMYSVVTLAANLVLVSLTQYAAWSVRRRLRAEG